MNTRSTKTCKCGAKVTAYYLDETAAHIRAEVLLLSSRIYPGEKGRFSLRNSTPDELVFYNSHPKALLSTMFFLRTQQNEVSLGVRLRSNEDYGTAKLYFQSHGLPGYLWSEETPLPGAEKVWVLRTEARAQTKALFQILRSNHSFEADLLPRLEAIVESGDWNAKPSWCSIQ